MSPPNQRNAQVERIEYLHATLDTANSYIDYYAGTKFGNKHTNGIYINGELVANGSYATDDVIIFKGNIDLGIQGPPGTETVFSTCDSTQTVRRNGHRVIYEVDSVDLNSVCVVRQIGPKLAGINPGATDTIDFSNDTSIVVFTADLLSAPQINTIHVYVESAIGRSVDTTTNDTTSNDTSGVNLDEHYIATSGMYPNPFHDRLSVPERFRNKKCRLVIYDISGRPVFHKDDIQEQVFADNLPSGIYIVHVSDNEERLVLNQKVIRQ